jgi:methanogenic corrinoid protein MtbC1
MTLRPGAPVSAAASPARRATLSPAVSSGTTFAAAVLDSTLAAQASGVALCLRERLGAGAFQELASDARVRLQYLAEALALGVPGVYLRHVAWLRDTYRMRGLDEELLRATLGCVRDVLREGLPSEAFAAVEPVLAQEERALAEEWREPPSALAGVHGRAVGELLEHVLGRSREAALAFASEQARVLGEEEFVHGVLVGVQSELGRLWQRGEIHVAEEHLGSRLTEDVLARLAPVASSAAGRADSQRSPDAPRVVVASAAGDLHDIGARIVARQLERGGFDVCFLGANVPRADLEAALRDLEPALLALSVSLGLHLRAAVEMVAAARRLEPRVPVLVGGAPFRHDPELVRVLGADAHADDARAAEREARALLGLPPRAGPGP